MRRVPIGLLLFWAACSPPPPEPTSVQRGASTFAPTADKLAASITADLKKADPAGFDRYVKEIGGKEEGDLVRKISKEVLLQYADALSMSSAKEAELKAGKADDATNQRLSKQLLATHDGQQDSLTAVGKAVAAKVRSGDWKGGLELEFAVRVLKAELPIRPKPKKL